MIIGAVQKGSEKVATYFYAGIPDGKTFEEVRQVCIDANCPEEYIEESNIICVATEGTGGRIVAAAVLHSNDDGVSLISADEYRREYLRIYTKEVKMYYDSERKR